MLEPRIISLIDEYFWLLQVSAIIITAGFGWMSWRLSSSGYVAGLTAMFITGIFVALRILPFLVAIVVGILGIACAIIDYRRTSTSKISGTRGI